MDKKIVGYTLIIAGIALIIVGALNVAGYLSFQVVDTTPPKILYTYPANRMTYKSTDLSEIIVYAQDASDVASASYSDKYGLKVLTITPYTQLKHPLVIQGWKYPDVNFDGKVDTTDVNLIDSLKFKTVGDPGYNKDYDLNSDGIIDYIDTNFAGRYVITVTLATFLTTSPYSSGDNVTFSFSVLDQCGNNAVYSGSFNIVGGYEQLSGKWKINDRLVTDNMMVELTSRKVNVAFICNDTTVNAQNVEAKVTVVNENKTYVLPYMGSNIWQGEFTVTSSTCTLILEASTQTKMNKIAVRINTPETPTITVGHALIVSGAILCIAGVVVLTKKEDAW
jgi:hypothetical protein